MLSENNGHRFAARSPSPKVILVLALLTIVVAVAVLIFVQDNSRWPIGGLLLTTAAGQIWTLRKGFRKGSV